MPKKNEKVRNNKSEKPPGEKNHCGQTMGEDGKYLTGRPMKEFNQEQFEQMCKFHCTQEEVCAMLNMSVDTLNDRIRKTYGEQYTFSKVFPILAAEGKMSLRRAQFKNAVENDNVTMQKWLGMNLLGQSDKSESVVKEKVVYVSDYSGLDDETLDERIKAAEEELGIKPDEEASEKEEADKDE